MDHNLLSPYIRRTWYSTLKAPWHIKTRVLVDYEIIYVAKGSATVTVEGVAYRVKKRDVIFIPPGVKHSILVDTEDFVQPHVHFDPIYTEQSPKRKVSFSCLENMSEEQRTLMQANIFKEYSIPYVFQPREVSRFEKYLFDMIEARNTNREHNTVLCKAKMLMLLRLILKQFVKASDNDNSSGTYDEVKSYIDNNYDQIITLDYLEKQFCINKFTLMRRFKNIYGINVITYYNDKRLEFAKQRLEKSEQSITQIAHELSFTDVYSFSRFFKNRVGVSPKSFRGSNR